MNIFRAMAVPDVDEATRAIPVIDFASAFLGEPGGLDAVAAQVRHACETVGFFYLAGHGVPAEMVDAAFAASREFHALPLEDKQALPINENNIGYFGVNQSVQGASSVHKATRPNYNESFVNLGNIMKRWSNDRFLSTPHGVLNDSGRDRYSIAFFYSPNVDSVIECVPTCVGPDNPSRYERAVYRDLVLAFYNANYFHRKNFAGHPAA